MPFDLQAQSSALVPPLTQEELLGRLRTSNVSPFLLEESSRYLQQARHDSKVLDLQIRQLRAKRFALDQDIARYGSLHSPIRKLPPEILRRIFHIVCDVDEFKDQWKAPAFRLGRVCSQWRDIVLDSPELWTMLRVSLTSSKSIGPLRLMLDRSKNLPLSVEMHGEGLDWEAAMKILLKLLKDQSTRWRSFEILPATLEEWIVDPESFGDTPVLEYIEGISPDVLSTFLPSTPQLNSVRYVMDDEYVDSLSSFPWNTIRHFDMNYNFVCLDSFFEVLRQGSNLQTFAFRAHSSMSEIIAYDADLPEPIPSVVSRISTLSLRIFNELGVYELLFDIFRVITLPALTILSINFSHGSKEKFATCRMNGSWPSSDIHSFIKRSECSLTALTLEGIPLPDTDVIFLLQVIPSLVSFKLSGPSPPSPPESNPSSKKRNRKVFTVTRRLLKALEAPQLFSITVFSQRCPLLPKLETLELSVEHPFDADEGFVELVRSRWELPDADSGLSPDVNRLRTVVLRVSNRKLVESIYEPLKELDEEGLMVSVFGDGVRVI